ncbi:MAG: type II secretion system protein GspD [Terrimicrobiaceae bacterium]
MLPKTFVCLLVFALLLTPVQAQQLAQIPQSTTVQIPVAAAPPFEVFSDYGSGNALAEKLRNAPAKLYNFDRASLRDALRFMADDAGIPFVALQESSAAENTLVTFTLRASPFRALETIARANGIQLFFENGIWFMRPINEKELIGRIYKLKYNSQQHVTYKGGDSAQSGATTSTSTPSTASGIPDLNINIQGASEVFKVKTPEIIEQIKSLLGIPTSGTTAQMANEASVESFGQLQTPQALNPAGSQFIGGDTAKGDGGAQVIYNGDSNTIYVIATRQQHQWVEGFLSSADRPQALIGVEVKFFETTKDPKKELGINWAGTLEGGYAVTAQGTAGVDGNLNSGVITDTLNSVNQLNQQITAGGVTTTTDTRTANDSYARNSNKTTGFNGGYSAVLTPDAVSVSLQAFLSDKDTSTVQYPRVLTINNREVVIRSVVNQPVLAATSSVTPGVGGTTTASVSYLPIGTIINVLPKTMPDNSVVLNVAITVSSIIGFFPIEGNSYPIASSRVYNAALQVDSGYTLAVGGIEEAYDQRDKNGVPFLKDIPGVGELFKSRQRQQRKRNLIIFITPTVITNRTQSNGVSESPSSVLPVRPGEPTPPAFTPTGRLVGGQASVDEAISWLQRQVDFFRQIVDESRTDKDSIKQLKSVINTAEMLLEEIQRMEDESPDRMAILIKKEEQTLALREELKKVLGKSQKNLTEF